MKEPAVSALANDSRLLRIAKQYLGSDAIPFRATLFNKTSTRNWLVPWHQDTALPMIDRNNSDEWGPWSVKDNTLFAHAPAWALERVIALRVHLDDSNEFNGPLRLIPNSHRMGVVSEAEAVRLGQIEKHVECLAPKGSVFAMRPLTIHASSKCKVAAPRRVLHIEYIDSLDLGDGIRIGIA